MANNNISAGITVLTDGSTATTQSASDNSTKLATTAYADTAGGGGGAWVHLDSATASASSSIDMITGIDGTYDVYVLVLNGVVPASDTFQLRMRVSEDTGSTWKSGASDYRYAAAEHGGSSGSSSGSGYIALDGIGNASGEGLNAQIYFYNPSSTSLWKVFNFHTATTGFNPAAAPTGRDGTGVYDGTANAIDGVQFLMSSGNITSGTFRLYGISNS